MHFEGGADDHDISDLRLAAGETRVYDYDGGSPRAATMVVSVDVEPDEFYRRGYRSRLDLELTDEVRRLFRLALEYPLAEPYTVTVLRTPWAG